MSSEPISNVDFDLAGAGMLRQIADLYPICRSITGNGVRETLRRLSREIPLTIQEVPSGTRVFDWTVPKEWNIRDAWIKNAAGERLIDFRRCNLHVLNYSVPVSGKMPLSDLKPHLYSLPDKPDWIPYRTSYYTERWGFCLSHRQLESLVDGEYEVCIDSSLVDGSLTYGECYLPSQHPDAGEVLISCHVCHPSLANDNLSGIAISTYLAKVVQAWPGRRFSYRFLFLPVTIGAICWLAANEAGVGRIKHGLVLSCVGDAGNCTYKKSRQGDAAIDRIVEHVLRQSGTPHEITDFVPYGYDERQYCSPGFNLPVGCFMRTPNGRYPEYHTSADNLDLVRPEALADSLKKLLSVLFIIENDRKYLNQFPKCEPQLGKRGLYASTGGPAGGKSFELALLWVLNLADGTQTLLDIAQRSKLEFPLLKSAADALAAADLIKVVK